MLTRHARKDQEPVADPRLASLLEAAGAPAESGPAPGEAAALAAFRSLPMRAHRRSRMRNPTTPLKSLAVAAASAGLLLTGGLAAANAGVLPGAAQDTAHKMLDTVGVEVPGANEHSAGHADTRGRSGHASDAGTAHGNDPESANEHGKMVSELAKSTEGGPEKGKTISEAARGDHGHAEAPENANAGAHHAQAPAATNHQSPTAERQAPAPAGQGGDHAPVATPNGGGTGTADDASNDRSGAPASTNGTERAGDASGGRSAAGSDNATARGQRP